MGNGKVYSEKSLQPALRCRTTCTVYGLQFCGL